MFPLSQYVFASAFHAELHLAPLAVTRMYEQHFNFHKMPFTANPADWHFFQSESAAALLPKLLHTLQFSSGVAVVTGPGGVGKTVLLHHLHTKLSKQGQTIILSGTSLQSVDDLYLSIRRSLKTLDGPPVTTGSGRWDVVERLLASAEFWGPIRLLVDDAHLLDPDIFTELQFLLEQRAGEQTICRLLLAGSHTLEETLARPALSDFAQRIRTFTFLQPLRLAESIEYLKSRLSHAGSSLGSCFDSDAVEATVEAADGSPRCLNLLADESLISAFHDNQDRVTLATVHTALSSLQHLPHAWNISASNHSDAALDDTAQQSSSWQSSSDGVIEIGAPQEIECDGPGTSQSTSKTDESTADHHEPRAAEGDSIDLQEALPALDDIATDPCCDKLEISKSLSTLEDQHDFHMESIDPATGKPERSFDAGYLLGELESVGDPAVEIDDSLDQRLLRIADAADNVSANSDEPESSDTFDSYRQWQPAGIWPAHADQPEDVIRHSKQLETPARSYSKTTSPSSIANTESSSIIDYQIEIPDDSHPEPVWPAETAGLSPYDQIPVTVLKTPSTDEPRNPDLSPNIDEPFEHYLNRASFNSPITWEASVKHQWSDGQLLSDLSLSPKLSKEALCTEEDSSTGVAFRSHELIEDQQELQNGDVLADKVPPSDQMFTLPISVSEVTGDDGPLPHPVQKLRQQEESLCKPVVNTMPYTGDITSPVTPIRPLAANGEAKAEVPLHAIIHNSDSEALTMMHPQLVSQARQIVGDPARKLKSAPATENSISPQDTRPALSVTAWDEPQEFESVKSPDEPSNSEAPEDRFRNLFTRLRQQPS
jgi:type II secretory pathway predicted ATPase ExeA